jgi:hypothetical protein
MNSMAAMDILGAIDRRYEVMCWVEKEERCSLLVVMADAGLW